MARLIPLIVAALAALAVGSGAGWYFGMASAAKPAALAEEAPHYVEYPIKDRVVNLADPGVRRYLKVSMVLQVAESKSAKDGAKAHAAPPDLPAGTVLFVSWEPSGAESTLAAASSSSSGGEKEKVASLPNAPQVEDAITSVLSAKRLDEITTYDGRERLREELRARINTVLPAGMQVVKIYFVDFLVQ
jgi:flagellar basal body-associated protein FliL